jgi:hypothetical protein
MSDTAVTLVVLAFYKAMVLFSGLFIVYLGFRLYCRGVFDASAELIANIGKKGIIFRSVAPGLFFVIFGISIMSMTVWKGLTVTTTGHDGVSQGAGASAAETTSVADKVITISPITSMLAGAKPPATGAKPPATGAKPPATGAKPPATEHDSFKAIAIGRGTSIEAS